MTNEFGESERSPVELPDPPREGRAVIPPPPGRAFRAPSSDDAEKSDDRGDEVERPRQRSGDAEKSRERSADEAGGGRSRSRRRRRGGRGRNRSGGGDRQGNDRHTGRGGNRRNERTAEEIDAELIARRRGKERDGRPLGRYLMCVHVRNDLTQVAVLEGRSLIEHYVSRPADDVNQIHGNIYLGKVQNVLPGMEAAFVDIATPKNAVLYRGDVQFDKEDVVEQGPEPRIEQVLKRGQLILCQVTKNPIGEKGARLTQEVSLPGRFVVLIPDSKTYGISKRLPENERRRLRTVLDRIKPKEHGLIVRTAAENATEHELATDMKQLVERWDRIKQQAEKASSPTLLYREPSLAVRVIREEFSSDYRGIVIDDRALYEEVRDYITDFNPEFVDRVEYWDERTQDFPLFEQHRVVEQLRKALDRKVWLPSGGSLVIEHTEALTVIDVNTGKNVGKTNLEETVLGNNLEAAEEIAHQLRLRDIGGIIVIDFIDMEVKENRRKVVEAFRKALSRDKTRTQVFDISELGLVQMTRKRIGEGLLTAFADTCQPCHGRGVIVDTKLLEDEAAVEAGSDLPKTPDRVRSRYVRSNRHRWQAGEGNERADPARRTA
ncbi:MAG: Rne/Rng family ribonuclease [Actinomycetota bacterium]